MVHIADLESREFEEDVECPECGSEHMRYGLENAEGGKWQSFVGCDLCDFEDESGEIEPSEVSTKEEAIRRAKRQSLKYIDVDIYTDI
jgi:hypothetical protein